MSHKTLDKVDNIKEKLTDQEYIEIVESLRDDYKNLDKEFYHITYQLTQVHTEENDFTQGTHLNVSHALHSTIVHVSDNTELRHSTEYNLYTFDLLLLLRHSCIEKYFIEHITEHLSTFGLSSWGTTTRAMVSGMVVPWQGTKRVASDVFTQLSIVKCVKYV